MSDVDVRIFFYLHHALSGGWLLPAAILSAIGGGWGALFAIPLFASPRTRPMARVLGVVLASTAVLVYGLKILVARARPCNCLADVQAQVFSPPRDFSFPSGHSAGSFSFCVFIAIVLVRTAPPEGTRRVERTIRFVGATLLVFLAISVGLSRISLGVHFPGDVFAGALIGSTVAAVGAGIHLRRARI